jgi:hypothetical protein
MKTLNRKLTGLLSVILLMMACSLPGLSTPPAAVTDVPTDAPVASIEPATETVQPSTNTPAPTISHTNTCNITFTCTFNFD